MMEGLLNLLTAPGQENPDRQRELGMALLSGGLGAMSGTGNWAHKLIQGVNAGGQAAGAAREFAQQEKADAALRDYEADDPNVQRILSALGPAGKRDTMQRMALEMSKIRAAQRYAPKLLVHSQTGERVMANYDPKTRAWMRSVRGPDGGYVNEPITEGAGAFQPAFASDFTQGFTAEQELKHYKDFNDTREGLRVLLNWMRTNNISATKSGLERFKLIWKGKWDNLVNSNAWARMKDSQRNEQERTAARGEVIGTIRTMLGGGVLSDSDIRVLDMTLATDTPGLAADRAVRMIGKKMADLQTIGWALNKDAAIKGKSRIFNDRFGLGISDDVLNGWTPDLWYEAFGQGLYNAIPLRPGEAGAAGATKPTGIPDRLNPPQ